MKNLFKMIFKKNQFYDVIFYYPIHFNRGEKGENIFFEPFYEICKKNNLKYLIIEEPVLFSKTKYSRNKNATPFDVILFFILILRKVLPLKKFDSFQKREQYIGKILKKIFFRNIEFNNFVTISNSMEGVFRGINDNANIFDYQHGVIFNNHEGYFKDNQVASHIKENNVKVLTYGKGFKKILEENTKDDFYKKNAIVIGKKLKQFKNLKKNKNRILFTLQLVSETHSKKEIEEGRNLIYKFLIQNRKFFEENNIKLIFKPHPRCNQKDLPKEWEDEFNFVYFSNEILEKLLNEVFLHITFSSSTVFEAAERKIPTIFLKNNFNNTWNGFYYFEDFKYPIKAFSEKDIYIPIQKYLSNDVEYELDSKKVYDWYKYFFENLKEDVFVKIVKDKNV